MNTTKLTTYLTTLTIALLAILAPDAQAVNASANLNVSATVVANCTISTTDLSFGEYDPIGNNAADPLTGDGVVTVTCTRDAQVYLLLGQGEHDEGNNPDTPNRRMSDDGSNYVNYALYSDPGRTVVWGGAEESCIDDSGIGEANEHIVYGSIPAGQNVREGSYSDVVLATVMF